MMDIDTLQRLEEKADLEERFLETSRAIAGNPFDKDSHKAARQTAFAVLALIGMGIYAWKQHSSQPYQLNQLHTQHVLVPGK